MAQKKKKRKSSGKGRGGGPTTVGGATGRPRRSGPDPLRGLMLGGAVIVLLALFFFLQIGGKTPFNHILEAVGLAGGDDEAPAAAPAAPQGSAAPAGAPVRAKAPTPPRPKVAAGAKTAPPMEKVTEDEQAALDELIEKTAQ
jgi:hypothetical protein